MGSVAKKWWAAVGLGLLVLLIGWLCTATYSAQAQTEPRDCDNNAVIRCGVSDVNQLTLKFIENKDNTQAIYKSLLIASTDDFKGMVSGRVTRDGQVFAGNQLVATNAKSVGRQKIPGSQPIAGGLAFMRPTNLAFAPGRGSLSALVKMTNGKFAFAVLESCGNPVVARAVAPPSKPAVTPKTPSFSLNKEVRLHGDTVWQKAITVSPGEMVDFRLTIVNTGQVPLTNINIRDTLPNGVTGVDDSFVLDRQQINGSFTVHGTIVSTIGSLAVGQQAVVTFSVTVDQDTQACGAARLINTAFAKPAEVAGQSSQATVQVCQAQVMAAVAPVTPPAQPLPNTGAANIMGIFTLTTAGGALWHNLALRLLKRYGLK